jgi:hypothetical protein
MASIMFLEWEQKGHLLVAKDPIQDDYRWIIKPCDQSYDPRVADFELTKVKGGCKPAQVHFISRNKSQSFLKWKACLHRLSDIIDIAYNNSWQIRGKEEDDKIRELLCKMIEEPDNNYKVINDESGNPCIVGPDFNLRINGENAIVQAAKLVNDLNRGHRLISDPEEISDPVG